MFFLVFCICLPEATKNIPARPGIIVSSGTSHHQIFLLGWLCYMYTIIYYHIISPKCQYVPVNFSLVFICLHNFWRTFCSSPSSTSLPVVVAGHDLETPRRLPSLISAFAAAQCSHPNAPPNRVSACRVVEMTSSGWQAGLTGSCGSTPKPSLDGESFMENPPKKMDDLRVPP